MTLRAALAVKVGIACVVLASVARPLHLTAADVPDYAKALRRQVMLDHAGNQTFTIEERMAHYGIPGASVAVVENCRIVDARGFGVAAPDGRIVDGHTLFAAGSVSKVVSAVGALTLVQDGKLALDSDISGYTGGWELPRTEPFASSAVTLRRLLSHSAGLGVSGFKGYARVEALPSREQILDGRSPANTAAVRIEQEPGKAWRYSGGGFVLAQLMMEQADGMPFAQLMHRRVLVPSGMRDSTFQQPLDARSSGNVATGTLADGTPIPGGWRVYPEQAAAGLWSTPADLSRLAISIVHSLRGSNGALQPETTREMLRRQVGAWGLGVEIAADDAPRKFSHTGAPVGYRTLWLMFPHTCQGATIMTNADEGMTFTYEVARAIADAYHWPDAMPSSVMAAIPLTTEIARRFVGEYQLRDFPDEHFEVVARGDHALRWSRKGRGHRDLVAVGPGEMVSPDSGMRLVALDGATSTEADTIELHFPGGVNIAKRVRAASIAVP